jgi:hypothetical protein
MEILSTRKRPHPVQPEGGLKIGKIRVKISDLI